MKESINYLTKGIILGVFVTVATGYEICEEFSTYYTYCEDGYECCGDYCCPADDDGLSTGAIVGIVFGCIVFLALCVGCCYKSCAGEGDTPVRPVHPNTIHVQSTVNEPPTMLYSQPNSSPVPTDQTYYYMFIPGAAGP